MVSPYIPTSAGEFLNRYAEKRMQLEHALIAGNSMTQLRKEIRVLSGHQDRHQARMLLEASEFGADRDEDAQAMYLEIAAEDISRLAAAMVGLEFVKVQIQRANSGAILITSYIIAQAGELVATAASLLRAAEVERQTLAARITTPKRSRGHITGRNRDRGEGSEGAEQIALVDADMESLRALLAQADRCVSEARAPLVAARLMLAMARYEVRRVENQVLQSLLLDHAGRVAEVMQAILERIEQLRALNTKQTVCW